MAGRRDRECAYRKESKMSDCLDCKHCKVIRTKCTLRCMAGHWLKETDGEEKIIRLTINEARTLRIGWRDIFSSGERCSSMISMV